MSITLYGIPNCDTVKKARSWLDQHGIAYAFTLSVAGEPAYYISSSGGEGASESLFYRLTEDGPEPALQVPTEPYLAVDYY